MRKRAVKNSVGTLQRGWSLHRRASRVLVGPLPDNGTKGVATRSVRGDKLHFRHPNADKMEPKAIVRQWVDAFNRADLEALVVLYHEDAINHQVAESQVSGKDAIREMFRREFAAANKMVCIVENLFQDGEWAVLEWRDPLGLRGCGFFQIQNHRIVFQRGYWDKLSFLKIHRLA